MQKLVKTKKSMNNLMSMFGLIEENMKLSHIHLANRLLFSVFVHKNNHLSDENQLIGNKPYASGTQLAQRPMSKHSCKKT